MRMSGRPRQHRERHSEIVMLTGRAFEDCVAVAKFGLQIDELIVGLLCHRTVDNAHLVGDKSGVQIVEQIRAADVVD